MLQTVRAEKVDAKECGHWSSFMIPIWVMAWKLPKKVLFFTILCWLSQKSKSVEAIYIYASESTHYALSENAMISTNLSHLHEILAIKISKTMLT